VEYGVFNGRELIQTFENDEEGKEIALNLFKESGEVYFCRRLHFDELTEDSKIRRLKNRLDELNEFLDRAKESGRTYRSDTSINADELEWLLNLAQKQLQMK
jgi:hypothetical protein